ncbi:MAG TPA: hypothetical protein VGC64_07130 [Pyrinomonadaceae bacterium]
MCVVQGANLGAIVITIILARRSNNTCPHRRKITETMARQS